MLFKDLLYLVLKINIINVLFLMPVCSKHSIKFAFILLLSFNQYILNACQYYTLWKHKELLTVVEELKYGNIKNNNNNHEYTLVIPTKS